MTDTDRWRTTLPDAAVDRHARGGGASSRARTRTVQAVLAVLAVCAVMAAAALVAALSDRIPDVGYLTRDPTSVAHAPWWYGVLSRLTNLVWAVAATACVLAGLMTSGARRWPLLLLGALAGALGLDDTILLHDAVLPGRGILEGVVLLGYVVAGLVLALLWWPHRRSAPALAFFAGAALLGVSVGLDDFMDKRFVLEDGTKLLGAVLWAMSGGWAFADELRRLRAGQRDASHSPVEVQARAVVRHDA